MRFLSPRMSHYACSLCRFWPVNCIFRAIKTLDWLFRHYSGQSIAVGEESPYGPDFQNGFAYLGLPFEPFFKISKFQILKFPESFGLPFWPDFQVSEGFRSDPIPKVFQIFKFRNFSVFWFFRLSGPSIF